jgi:hypothetical protein
MTRWPHWYPGKPLTAQDLLGLENYLLARTAVVDCGYGIVDFDFYSIGIKPGDGTHSGISVSSLKGITPGGLPVIVGEGDDSLEATTDLRIDAGARLNLSITVDAGSAARAVPPGAERTRLSLQCRPATDSPLKLQDCDLDLGG